MGSLFRSATVRLTGWYLAIIITISLLFSMVIYLIAAGEITARIDYWQTTPLYNTNKPLFLLLRERQIHQAEMNLVAALGIANGCIWIAGGVGSYYLARQTLRRIEEAHEAQSRFTSDASHELRTPLASMKTEIEVTLRNPKASATELRQLLASNLEEVDKLATLSQTLLELSQLDHVNLAFEKVGLNDILQATASRFANHKKRLDIDPGPARFINAHSASIEELLTILLDNALKYSPSDSTVTAITIKHRNLAGFAVTNSGAGISAEKLPYIFERFYRADSSRTSERQKSYGLGLALAKKIVELHGGELTVSSAPGKTTTFRALFPCSNSRATSKK